MQTLACQVYLLGGIPTFAQTFYAQISWKACGL